MIIIGCHFSTIKTEKAEFRLQNAEKDVAIARLDLYKTRLGSIYEYEQFRKESQEIISYNEKNIAWLNAIMAIEDIENKTGFEKKLIELEQKNDYLIIMLENYREGGKGSWEILKTEFISTMNDFGTVFKDLTILIFI